jgi:nucleoside-diphosphate-sugar epimerase
VLLSSISVYGEGTAPTVVDEDSLCNPVGEYPETKLACEALWREGLRRDCFLTILHPSEIVGPGGRGLLPFIRDALERPLMGVVKRGVLYHRRLHYVAVSNVAAAVLFCMERPPTTRREIYIVSDDHRPENESYAAM